MKIRLACLILTLLASPLGAAPRTHTIVVFPFANLSGRADLAWISESFPVTLDSRLAGQDRYVLTRRERNTACDQLGLADDAPLTLASLYKVAETLGADWVVTGNFNVQGNRLTVHAQLLDLGKMKLSPPLEASGELADLADLQTQIAWRLLGLYDTGFVVGKEEDFARQFRDVRLDAFENYVRGILAPDGDTRVRFLTEADRRDPGDHRAAFALGGYYVEQKDYASAVRWLAKLEPADANYLESLFLRGVSEYFLGRDADAAKDFQALSQQIPLNEVFNNLGVMQFHQGQFAAALESFDRASHGDPTDPEFLFNRAACLWSLGRYGDAAEALQKFVRPDYDDAEAHTFFAAVLTKLGDTAGQKREVEWLVAHEGSGNSNVASVIQDYSPQPRLKKNYDGHAFRLLGLTVRNQLEASLAKLPPAEHARVHVERGRQLLKEGRAPEAEKELNEAVTLDPQSSDAHLLLGEALEAEGKHREAAQELETSLRLNNSVAARLVLARIYLSMNRADEARFQAQGALDAEPGNAEAVKLMEEIRQRAGERGSP